MERPFSGDRTVYSRDLPSGLARLCVQLPQPVCRLTCRKSVGFFGGCLLALLPETWKLHESGRKNERNNLRLNSVKQQTASPARVCKKRFSSTTKKVIVGSGEPFTITTVNPCQSAGRSSFPVWLHVPDLPAANAQSAAGIPGRARSCCS